MDSQLTALKKTSRGNSYYEEDKNASRRGMCPHGRTQATSKEGKKGKGRHVGFGKPRFFVGVSVRARATTENPRLEKAA